MQIWHNCTADVIYYDETPAVTHDLGYEVKIDGEIILVTYQDDMGWVEYRGEESGEGHYLLKCPERNGVASLHRFPNDEILEGFWIEDGTRGMWRIVLR